jgi:cell fate (sporulation/competence/biofilm development) regulator YlbF (YheA/YmcA/DUF963 family)
MELELLKITSTEGGVKVEINGDVLDITHALAVIAHQSPHFMAMMKTAIQLANDEDMSETFESVEHNETLYKNLKTQGNA